MRVPPTYLGLVMMIMMMMTVMMMMMMMIRAVVILSVRGPLVREFLLAAHALGMTRGDWAFLDVEIFQVIYWAFFGWLLGSKAFGRARDYQSTYPAHK